ncbi:MULTISPECIES: hypothetical protein [unclassified Streptomyces]|uniref:hypothetical protein n=1 Tax=unclassified Streptomyces TaxID=2593676 RepID=UPI00081DD1A8|nr:MULTISPECIES: hypothetical protein [unclassified Streptomyces]MYR30571.1 hypothetical protein [Streptomyces sp. SID4945]SCF50148.1 hypothetical protein GA0115257_124110 [Streptomyces sp. LcepLS]
MNAFLLDLMPYIALMTWVVGITAILGTILLLPFWIVVRIGDARTNRQIARKRAAAEAEVADAVALDNAGFDEIVRQLDMPEWGDAA